MDQFSTYPIWLADVEPDSINKSKLARYKIMWQACMYLGFRSASSYCTDLSCLCQLVTWAWQQQHSLRRLLALRGDPPLRASRLHGRRLNVLKEKWDTNTGLWARRQHARRCVWYIGQSFLYPLLYLALFRCGEEKRLVVREASAYDESIASLSSNTHIAKSCRASCPESEYGVHPWSSVMCR